MYSISTRLRVNNRGSFVFYLNIYSSSFLLMWMRWPILFITYFLWHHLATYDATRQPLPVKPCFTLYVNLIHLVYFLLVLMYSAEWPLVCYSLVSSNVSRTLYMSQKECSTCSLKQLMRKPTYYIYIPDNRRTMYMMRPISNT